MDHAGEELERSAKLLHRPVARAHDQAREIGIMQSQVFFYVDMQGKGKGPLPLHPIPKTNNNSKTKSNNKTKTKTKNKIKVVYTEDLTHPKVTQDNDTRRCPYEAGRFGTHLACHSWLFRLR